MDAAPGWQYSDMRDGVKTENKWGELTPFDPFLTDWSQRSVTLICTGTRIWIFILKRSKLYRR